jgi:HSP20 family molecular chaperone IbpA
MNSCCQSIERAPAAAASNVVDSRPADGWSYHPDVDIVSQTGEITISLDMPGVGRDAFDITFENGTLMVHGRVAERVPQNAAFLRREYGVGDYYRSFRIGEEIDAEAISAECAQGVLTIHLPKREAARPKKIAVK